MVGGAEEGVFGVGVCWEEGLDLGVFWLAWVVGEGGWVGALYCMVCREWWFFEAFSAAQDGMEEGCISKGGLLYMKEVGSSSMLCQPNYKPVHGCGEDEAEALRW